MKRILDFEFPPFVNPNQNTTQEKLFESLINNKSISQTISEIVTETKVCSKCKTKKELKEFYPIRNGLTGRCKDCIRTYQDQWNKTKKKEKIITSVPLVSLKLVPT